MVKRRKTGTKDRNQKSGLQLPTPIPHNDSERLHLTSREVEQLLQATKGNRNEAGDRCLLLLLFRHGLRVSEGCQLKMAHPPTGRKQNQNSPHEKVRSKDLITETASTKPNPYGINDTTEYNLNIL